MKIIKPYYTIETPLNSIEILQRIEAAGRTCYKSEDKITPESAGPFVAALIKRGHESVLEHVSITVRFVCDRGVSHELVRHRLASFSQESTRYCNFSDNNFGNEITVIEPCFWSDSSFKRKAVHGGCYEEWKRACKSAEKTYMDLISLGGATPQEARSVLPNSLKTEIVMTANLREWRLILKQRTAKDAHPQMRELMCPLLKELKNKVPVVFDDIKGE